MKKSGFIKNYAFLITLIAAMVLGCIVGLIWPGATVLQPLGTIFVNLMLCLVVPLVFTSISSAVAAMGNRKRAGKIMASTVILFLSVGVLAALIMITICRILPPILKPWEGLQAASQAGQYASWSDMLVNAFTVGDFVSLLSRKNLLPLIVFSILFGVAANITGGAESKIARALVELNEVILQIVKIITWYAPIAFFALFAALVATYGSQIVGDYGRSLLIYYPTCVLYIVIFYPIYAYIGGGKGAPKLMFSKILRPIVTALGTCSSAATIPTNLDVAEETGISKDVADIVIPLGATIHMDGVVFSTVMKIFMLFGIFGVPFHGAGNYVLMVFIAVFGAVGGAAVPGGGLIVEYIICVVFMPDKFEIAYPIMVAFGNLIDPPATMVNSSGDYVMCYIIERIVDGKDWLQKKLHGEKAIN